MEKSRKVARCTYTPPRRGGLFALSSSEFIGIPFLSDFAESKVIAALILTELWPHLLVATDTVKQELTRLQLTDQSATSMHSDYEGRPLATLTAYNGFNKHSIVCYNVGYRSDQFDKGMPSLENKGWYSIYLLISLSPVLEKN